MATLIPVYGFYRQVVMGLPFGDNPMPDIGIIIFLIVMVLLLLLFWLMKLKTEITDDHISIHFFPFTKSKHLLSDVKSANIVNYGFVGYGIRLGTKYGTVYNTKGNIGLAIQLKNGKKYCVGTQLAGELEKVIDEVIKT